MSVAFTDTRRPLTIEDYYRMGEAGIFAPDERLELINGELRRMAPIGADHFRVANRLRVLLESAAGKAAIVYQDTPVHLQPGSAPEPDVLALKWRADDYDTQPTPADVLLLVEVSDTTLKDDMGEMRDLYAKHLICEYWVIDVNEQKVFVHTEPAAGAYEKLQTLKLGDVLTPLALPAVRIAVADVFARARR